MESYVTVGKHGTTSFVGPDATKLARAILLKSSLSLYIKCGIIPTRGVTITKMLGIVSEYTKKTYKRGNTKSAIDDLVQWIEAMKAAMPIVDKENKNVA